MSRCEAIIYEGTTPFQCEREAPHDGEQHINLETNIQWEFWID